jgi:hypothetical protein
VIQRKDIEEITKQAKSLMPEGLANNMTVADFRDLVRYVMAHPFLTEVLMAGPYARLEGIPSPPRHPGDNSVWKRPAVGPTGRIPLPPAKGNGKMVACMTTEVTAPAALSTTLLLGAAHQVQIWVNGKPVYKGQPASNQAEPDQAAVAVDLGKGVNQLAFKITYEGDKEGIFARLLDPQRQLRYPEPPK